ncbi:proprotein convertase subtilisin/kexin type 4-like isoform X3 [Paralichthys olivaceus]|uniref:proprotein convertase subtilisin/kexin type 4-like isoform X3 n=1 Tax=Paralichthys olivaceus TaxID=8255 RepID=UPI003753155E
MRKLAVRPVSGGKFRSGRGRVALTHPERDESLLRTSCVALRVTVVSRRVWMASSLLLRRTTRNKASGGGCSCVRKLSRLDGRGSMFSAVVLVLGCLLQRNLVTTEGHHGTKRSVFYAVHVEGGIGAARALVAQHGLEFIHQVGSLEGVYSLRDSRGRSDRATFESRLATAAGVHWLQRQHSHYREKRVPVKGLDHSNAHSSPRREYATDRHPEERKSDQSLTFNDPLWPMQWELFAQGEYRSSESDLNVMPVWSNNITGNGVVVSIIDDGIDHKNKDLQRNFEALASFDLCASHGPSHDPMPVRDEENSHGTRCAGEVAMEANNSYCGVGIAFNARIGGIRLLNGNVTDAMEATALTFNIHFIDIFVCSWGPRDDGAELDGPHSLTEEALRLGTHKGRGGKGSIFVWAAGNGGLQHDHCGADGYVNSIYNIAISAVTQTGKPAYFGEPCPGVMAVTLTGASVGGPLPLVTVTTIGDGCITHFPGTSSAAPIAAGILALVLEVKYGFGLLDAGLMVQQAAHFNTAAHQRKCTQEVPFDPTRILSSGGGVSVNIPSEACSGGTNEISTLEHVQVRVTISTVCRGDLSISLQSPGGTVSLLLDTRPNDASTAGLTNWIMMTVHCWGEQPQGLWTLQVTDHKGTVRSCARLTEEEAAGALLAATLILYGTYHPHRTTHERPLQSIVSMGSRHPVPHKWVYQRDPYLPLGLIQWIYQMERERKVRAADITESARSKIHQMNVQKSSTRPAAAVKPFHETLTIPDDVKGENRPLPLQSLQHAVMVEVPPSDSSDPGGGGAVSGEAGERTRQ